MSQLSGPFNGDVKSAPSPTATQCGNKFGVTQLNQPEDTSVLKTVFYDESGSLKGAKPAPLESPFENDFRPGVGRS
jgi:hypothetical protein